MKKLILSITFATLGIVNANAATATAINVKEPLTPEYFVAAVDGNGQSTSSGYCWRLANKVAENRCKKIGPSYRLNAARYELGTGDESYAQDVSWMTTIYYNSCTGYARFSCQNIVNSEVVGFVLQKGSMKFVSENPADIQAD